MSEETCKCTCKGECKKVVIEIHHHHHYPQSIPQPYQPWMPIGPGIYPSQPSVPNITCDASSNCGPHCVCRKIKEVFGS